MPARNRLVVVRHTTVGVPPGLCYGRTDVPLAATYPDDRDRVRASLPAWPFARVFSSPLHRCHQLALDLQRGPVETDERLRELSFGAWEGLLWNEIPRAASEYWTEDVLNRAPPDGESFAQLIARARSFFEDPTLWSRGSDILVVTHAGVIRALHHILSGDDYETSLRVPIAFGEFRVWEQPAREGS